MSPATLQGNSVDAPTVTVEHSRLRVAAQGSGTVPVAHQALDTQLVSEAHMSKHVGSLSVFLPNKLI